MESDVKSVSRAVQPVKKKKKKKRPTSYPVYKIDPSHRPDLGGVVDEADVPLCGGVQLSDFNVPEAIQKLDPDVAADAVADGDSHFVVPVVVFLQRVRWRFHREINVCEGFFSSK